MCKIFSIHKLQYTEKDLCSASIMSGSHNMGWSIIGQYHSLWGFSCRLVSGGRTLHWIQTTVG